MNSIRLIKRAPGDLAETLRRIADQVDSGEVSSANMVYVANGNYEFVFASSLSDGVVMSALLHQNCIDRMRT